MSLKRRQPWIHYRLTDLWEKWRISFHAPTSWSLWRFEDASFRHLNGFNWINSSDAWIRRWITNEFAMIGKSSICLQLLWILRLAYFSRGLTSSWLCKSFWIWIIHTWPGVRWKSSRMVKLREVRCGIFRSFISSLIEISCCIRQRTVNETKQIYVPKIQIN